MTKNNRKAGKLIREITKLDKMWRAAGKPEGKIANRLAWKLGIAYRSGLGDKARAMQNANAKAIGEKSGWEK